MIATNIIFLTTERPSACTEVCTEFHRERKQSFLYKILKHNFNTIIHTEDRLLTHHLYIEDACVGMALRAKRVARAENWSALISFVTFLHQGRKVSFKK